MFHPDGKHVLGGYDDGIRQWQFADGEVIGMQMGMELMSISGSMDHKWVVCGTNGAGASVWDREMREKAINVEDENIVDGVDVSPDSTRFATGNRDGEASIWSIPSGERLVGPLKHDAGVRGIRFSPNGEHIATASNGKRIRIFDSRNGDELITIAGIVTPRLAATTPIAWSRDGRQIFATSEDVKIKAFDASTGTQLAESQILHDGGDDVPSIALAANGKFVATIADHSIVFLDTSTLSRIDPVIEDGERIRSIAISPDSRYVATGRFDGKIAIRDLGKILPELYGPVNVSICAFLCSISHVDNICRYLLAKKNKFNKMSSH